MEITAKQLRVQSGKIMSRVHSGQEITITYRGKPHVKMVPIFTKREPDDREGEDELFGLWMDRENTKSVDQLVRNMRKGRKF